VKAFAWNRRASSMLSRRVRRSSAAWLRTPTKGRGSDESAHGRYSSEGPARSYAASSSDEEADDDLEGDLGENLGRRSDRRESARSPLSPIASHAPVERRRVDACWAANAYLAAHSGPGADGDAQL
jgi:hypothetical protein